ncbi:transglutaminase-like domain-containing protein [Bifidobacterium aerophilum]|uniref:Transglutaminase-like domain-containing protein n=1 Tax=Bifidobacterium aerophilum TaxID=1798155 RepID=A0A6N9Z1M2_9BIFI|nr:transglutaminase-like domain-containing protein [Bifidobacterium aerophilum]NEG88458.1 hypothetical protein [Bifidobacterium aerophilum]
MSRIVPWLRLSLLSAGQFLVGPLAVGGISGSDRASMFSVVSEGWVRTVGSFQYLLAVAPPIGTSDGSLSAVWTICLWVSLLLGVCLFEGHAPLRPRVGMMPVVLTPVLSMASFGLCASLGTAAGFLRAQAGIAATLMTLAALAPSSSRQAHASSRTDATSRRHAGAQHVHGKTIRPFARWRIPVSMTLVTVLTAMAVCGLVEARRFTLRDRYEPPVILQDHTSPLSGMRAYVKRFGDDVALSVTGLPAGTPIRLAVMEAFDGTVWNLSAGRRASSRREGFSRIRSVATPAPMEPSASSPARSGPDATGTGGQTTGEPFTATFTVGVNFGDIWLPTAGTVSAIAVSDEAVDGVAFHDDATGSAILPHGLRRGTSYVQVGTVVSEPDDSAVAEADAGNAVLPAPEEIPESLRRFADDAVSARRSDGHAAQLLTRALRERGWFSHGGRDEYPSAPGHGSKRLDELVSGTVMVGDDEQYASAMALMARHVGLPSRVVMGFLPKDETGDPDMGRTVVRADGTTHVEFTGNDIAAWVEIELDGLGWVMFRPSPQESHTLEANAESIPEARTMMRHPLPPLTDPPDEDHTVQGRSTVGGDDAEPAAPDSPWHIAARIVVMVLTYGGPVWVMLSACLSLMAFKWLMTTVIRCRGSPGRRIEEGWRALMAQALQCGMLVPQETRGTATRLEQARRIAEALPGTGTDSVTRLVMRLLAAARFADDAMFSGRTPDDDDARTYWKEVMLLRRGLLKACSRPRRVRARLSCRGMIGRC